MGRQLFRKLVKKAHKSYFFIGILASITVSIFRYAVGIGLSNSDILIMHLNNSSYLLGPIPTRSRAQDLEGMETHQKHALTLRRQCSDTIFYLLEKLIKLQHCLWCFFKYLIIFRKRIKIYFYFKFLFVGNIRFYFGQRHKLSFRRESNKQSMVNC